MTAELLARLGGLLAAGGLGLLLLAPGRGPRLGGLGLWVAGMALFVPLLAPSGRGPLLAAGALLGAGLAIALAFVFRRWPWTPAFLALAAAPGRIPVTVGDVSANLLLPLYAVIVAAAVGLGWSLWRDKPRRRELEALSWPLALFVGWTSVSSLWSADPTEGAVELFFFFFPFTILALTVARLPWSARALAWLGGLLATMALTFAAVGVWQWLTRDVFWNPKVIAGNAYAPFFRVNSLFWDPSIYGRFLVIAILLALVLFLFGPWRRWDPAFVLVIAALWVGLLFSFSQSSFAALIAGTLLAAALAWRWRAAVAVAAIAAVMIPVGVAAPERQDMRRSVVASSAPGLSRATHGRSQLIWNGLRIAADHPLVGVGVGGFEQSYVERFQPPPGLKEPASHTTPVTVLAETGVVGLALFVWLVAAAAVLAFRRARLGRPAVAVVGLFAGIALVGVFVHSLLYDAFFEDPLVWGFFALAALAARASAPRA